MGNRFSWSSKTSLAQALKDFLSTKDQDSTQIALALSALLKLRDFSVKAV